jgi:hypothetical protein
MEFAQSKSGDLVTQSAILANRGLVGSDAILKGINLSR